MTGPDTPAARASVPGAHVAVVGGGRWGRILTRTLVAHPLVERITVVTRQNRDRFERRLAESRAGERGDPARITVAADLSEVRGVTAAVVATRASEHFAAAAALLRGKVPVLVEKPFVETAAQERELIELAAEHRVALGIDHEFLLAAWVEELRDLVAGMPAPTQVGFVWHEPREVVRHGERRRTDLTVSACRDLFPHVLSVLTTVFGPGELCLDSATPRFADDGFDAAFTWGGVAVRCRILRNAPAQVRELTIGYRDSPTWVVDWRTEPAVLTGPQGQTVLGAGGPRTLDLAVDSFLRHVSDAAGASEGSDGWARWPLAARAAGPVLEGVRSVEDALAGQAQKAVLDACCRPEADGEAAAAALMRYVAEPLERTGLAVSANDWDTVREHAGKLVTLARRYSTEPFTPLEDARAELRMDRGSFARLVEVLRTTPAVRESVVRGPAAKYWTNTVLPLERAGAFDAVLENKPAFPARIGLYPGPTCMFRCSFCARVTGARYHAADLAEGNAALASVIDEAPTADPFTFYVSGGLEPLTNPGLGSLISRAAERGFSVSLYTNSYALTEHALRRQPGLWRAFSIRTSLYGTDEEEFRTTTTRAGAFERVTKNIQDFLRLRAERHEPVRVGLNYVVLPGRAARVVKVIEYIARLNTASSERPVDFLTLREDYSGRPQGILAESDRSELLDALCLAEERARELTPTLDIDFGYALHSIRAGAPGHLPMPSHTTIRPRGYPQVSVVTDLLGDVYLYREAAFPDLPGAQRYIIGRVQAGRTSLADIMEAYTAKDEGASPRDGDQVFLDAFDQVVTARMRQLESDIAAGWPAHRGLLR
ncbi:dTDP-4-amino-4,6-dideoxy-D-glucose ammonia-lyase [Streptomyces sp. NPDC050388]|uniref:dTDP-4-amino-4,6-dideoxy-D-glucose ammonia-lyase n=1 Tax=Streptomyces sp. NPDC050388 TaxID=3155781 RepID=UPI0034497958